MTLRLKLDIVSGAFEERVKRWNEIMARTSTLAMDDARFDMLKEGREDIAGAGGKFGRRWQSALRATRYPKGRDSMSAAVFVHHKIPYANLFEEGGSVKGNPMLWLPLPGTPLRVGRQRTTPKRLVAATGNPLIKMKTRGGKPLLGMEVRLPKTQAGLPTPKVTLSRLRNGRNEGGRGILRTIPLFVGLQNANHRKRFNIAGVAERIRGRLPEYFTRNFKDDD
jgi:hypothetical protein